MSYGNALTSSEGSKSGHISVEGTLTHLMKTPEGKEIAYLCYYDWNVLESCYRFEVSEEWRSVSSIIRELSPPGQEALDIGAGNGIGSYALAKLGYSVSALEPDPSNLVGYGALSSMVHATSLPIALTVAYGEDLPFTDNSFALVYMRQVLHHSRDLSQMTKEISRVLKPGGVLIASREHVIDDKKSLDEFLLNHTLHKYTGGENAFRLHEYRTCMRLSGLKVKKIIGPWDSVINHYPVSNSELREEMRLYAKRKFGKWGQIFIDQPWFEKFFRIRKSVKDRTPGRMFTFVAVA